MKFEPQLMTCYCCRRTYLRGHFRCCAPPSGMNANKWQQRFCRAELPTGERCNTCPRCGCEHRGVEKFTGLEIGMPSPSDIAPTRTRGDLKKFTERWSPHNS